VAVTTAAATNAATAVTTAAETKGEGGGCGGLIAAAPALLFIIAGCSYGILKKKKQ
jgi:hypothetical protein